MDKQHRSEKAAVREGQARDESLRSPEHFYPRPEDVVADSSLSRSEKLELLRNWQVQLQGRAGSLEDARLDHEPEDTEVAEALREARHRIEAQRGAS